MIGHLELYSEAAACDSWREFPKSGATTEKDKFWELRNWTSWKKVTLNRASILAAGQLLKGEGVAKSMQAKPSPYGAFNALFTLAFKVFKHFIRKLSKAYSMPLARLP